MDIAKVTVAQIFEKPRRYLVPLFQRRYVWSADEQWQPLWDDIIAQADAVGAAKSANKPGPRQHFMGAVVLGRETTGIREVPTSLLVDGQQRLTTMSVLLAALRDVGKSLGNDFLAQTLHRLVANPEPLQHPHEGYKVWPTQSDQAAFVDALTSGSEDAVVAKYPIPKKVKNPYGHRPAIIDAYLFFAKAIRLFLDEGKPAGDATEWMRHRTDILLDAITRHLQLVAIELDEEEDPQVIFETLNARGVPLLPSDLIRNFLFHAGQRQDGNVEQLYDLFWKPFDSDWKAPGEKQPFWQEKVKQGRIRRPRIDLFLFHYATLSSQQEIRIEHLFTEFRGWWDGTPGDRIYADQESRLSSGERSVAAELARLARFAQHFRQLQLPDRATRVGQFASRLKAIDTGTVFPLILTLVDRVKQLGVEDVNSSLTDLESYLVRRMVCGLTTKGYNLVFLDLLRRLSAAGDFSSRRLRAELGELTAVSDAWPSDEAFRKEWVESPMYARLGPAKTRMILEALELGRRTEKQEFQDVPGTLTVEHLLPQNPVAGDYPYALTGDGTAPPQAYYVERRERLLHSVGNLTLLTGALNKSVSNGPWSLKRPEIGSQSQLLLNRYCETPEARSGWDESKIIGRSEQLFEIALKVWPGPGTPWMGRANATRI